MNITILNIFIVIINALICMKLNTTQTIVLNNWLAYDWKLSLTILTTAISIPSYFYLGLVYTGHLLKIILLPFNVAVFCILSYILYLDNTAYYSEILTITSIGFFLIKNEWTYEHKSRLFEEFQKTIEYMFGKAEKESLIRIAINPTDLQDRMLKFAAEKTTQQSSTDWISYFSKIGTASAGFIQTVPTYQWIILVSVLGGLGYWGVGYFLTAKTVGATVVQAQAASGLATTAATMVRETLVSNQASQDILTAEQANALIVKEQLVSLTKALHIVITSLGIEIPLLYESGLKVACEMTKEILDNFDDQVFNNIVMEKMEIKNNIQSFPGEGAVLGGNEEDK